MKSPDEVFLVVLALVGLGVLGVFCIAFIVEAELEQKHKKEVKYYKKRIKQVVRFYKEGPRRQPEKEIDFGPMCDMCEEPATHNVEDDSSSFQLCEDCKDLVLQRAS